MSGKQKLATLLLIAAFVASMFTLLNTSSAVSTPSTPEIISVKYVDLSYDVAPVYGTDQYTGETVVKQEGYRIDNRSLAVTLRNQPFTAYNNANGTKIELYFNFRLKGSYGASWDYYPFAENGYTTQVYGGGLLWGGSISPAPELTQSNGEYTTITFTIPGAYRVPTNAVLDVQAQTMTGYMEYVDRVYQFFGESSGWTGSSTVIVGKNAPSSTRTPTQNSTVVPTHAPNSTPNPTANATQPDTAQNFSTEVDWQTVAIMVLIVGLVLLIVVVAVQQRRLGKISSQLQNRVKEV